MTLLTTLLLTATAASPLDGVPTYEPTPPPTLNAAAIDRSEAKSIEKGLTSWLARTNPAPDVELVQVRVETDGTVHLDGTVASSERRASVLAKARGFEDVAAVDASLSVKAQAANPLSFPTMGDQDPLADDAATTPRDAVLEALLDSAYLEAREIRVSMSDEGRIELTGTVDSAAQRDAAGRIARQTVDQPVDVDLRIRP